MVQVSSEDGLSQVSRGVGEPGLLLGGLDSVAAVKGKTNEAGVGGILDKLGGDLGGRLDALASDGEASDGNGIGVDVTAGAAVVTIGDGPAGSRDLLGGRRLGGSVDGVSLGRRRGSLGAEDPQIGRASVKVQGEDLSRSTNGDVGDVLIILRVAGVVGSRAGLASGELGSLVLGNPVLEVLADGSAKLSLGLEELGRSVRSVVGVVLDRDGDGLLLSLGGESSSQAASGEERNEVGTKGLHFEAC